MENQANNILEKRNPLLKIIHIVVKSNTEGRSDKKLENNKDHSNKSEGKSKKHKPYYPKSKDSNSVVQNSQNKPHKPHTIKKAIVKVPVILGETTVQIDMTAKIHFPDNLTRLVVRFLISCHIANYFQVISSNMMKR